jgi:hypothetical protein
MKLERVNGCWFLIRDGERIPINFSFVDLIEQAYQIGVKDGKDEQ